MKPGCAFLHFSRRIRLDCPACLSRKRGKVEGMAQGRSRWVRAALAAAILSGMAVRALAADANTDVTPAMWAFVDLSDRARLFFLGSLNRNLTQGTTDGTVGVHLDVALKPILRRRLRVADWARKKYLWVRVGYRQSFGSATRESGILEATSRLPLPRSVWMVSRIRTDLRNVNGSFSARPRYRLGMEREIGIGRLTATPYVRAEVLYDTRSSAWSSRYEAGVELALTRHWRIEPYYERRVNRSSGSAAVNQIGFIVKTYW